MAAKKVNSKKQATKKATAKKTTTKETTAKAVASKKSASAKETSALNQKTGVPKKIGRPTLDPKVKRIDIRLTDEDWQFLNEYCTKMGISKPQALRDGVKLLRSK